MATGIDTVNPADAELRTLAARLNTTVTHLNRRLRRTDDAMELPPAQASALALLVAAGRHTLGDLAAFERVAGPTMTRIVASLERRGLAARTHDLVDRRQVYIEATPDGRQLIREGRDRRLQSLEAELRALAPAELASLSAALDVFAKLAAHDR